MSKLKILLTILVCVLIGHFVFDIFGVYNRQITVQPQNWVQVQMRFINDEATQAEINAHTAQRDGQLQKIDKLIRGFHNKNKTYPKDKQELTAVIRREWPHYMEFRNYNFSEEGYYLSVYDNLMLEDIVLPLENVADRQDTGSVNQGLLEKMVLDPASSTRDKKKAAKNMTNQDVLTKIALTEKDFTLRRIAAEKITDQPSLKKIVETKDFPVIRSAAVKNITDQKYLEKLANNKDESTTVREAAIDTISDEHILASITRQDNTTKLRLRAFERIDDQDIIQYFTRKDYPSAIRAKALEKTALSGNSELSRLNAIQKIKDQKVLFKVAKETDSIRLKVAAIERISWRPYLDDLRETETDAYVINALNRRLAR